MSQHRRPDARRRFVGCLAMLGGAVAVAGSFLPWLAATGPPYDSAISRGTDSADGAISLVAGALVLVVGYLVATGFVKRISLRTAAWWLLVGAAILAMVAILDFKDVLRRMDLVEAQHPLAVASIGSGMWLVMTGAVTTILACFAAFTRWSPSGTHRQVGQEPPRPDGR